jgi:phage terminase small subunit
VWDVAASKPKAKAKARTQGPTKAPFKKPALDKRDIFIRQYLIHSNATRAYREAGYQDHVGIHQSASNLLRSPYVQSRIADMRAEQLAKLDVKVEQVFDRYRAVAFGDPAAITEFITGACRYCHGIEHGYQWKTAREFSDAVEEYMGKGEAYHANHTAPDCEGGFGYRFSNPPHPDCPECDGEGIPRVRFKDTRLMTDDERKLFAGVKETQNGIEFKLNDQMVALKALAEHLHFNKLRDESIANTLLNAITELQDRGIMGRMPIASTTPKPPAEGSEA